MKRKIKMTNQIRRSNKNDQQLLRDCTNASHGSITTIVDNIEQWGQDNIE